ncbi:EamA family transporter [Nonlabens ponticola]|uniref:EamA/RhaT family transporter n=1 Tax=Nonlabens ponticola TaxID=2496866 RepID=A0A3S9MXZ4_9FLAO|nr:EamA family transporter [Nonlabens ponticola]AZQ44008.1 EamA/RhaT family transporter [Nonlabens ponticola]
MMWLILSIATSSLLYVIFKYFSVFKVNTLHAIVINYLVAAITGYFMYQGDTSISSIPEANWLVYAAGLGILFFSIFNVMALTSQKNGLSVAAVASKMSLVIPVVFGIWVYEESLGLLKIAGILLALVAVYLASLKKKSGIDLTKGYLALPIILFIGSGVIDTTLKYAEKNHVPSGDEPLFSATCFAIAFIVGTLVLVYEAFKGNYLNGRSILAGIVLGVPNYFSIFFIIRALKTDMESSVVFPINHVGTVLFTAALGILIFKERLIPKNYIGIGVAVAAIILIAFAKA